MIEALDIQVKGIVQGVGFRPFVYRLAKKYLINGWVLNATDGVFIHVEGDGNLLDEFVLEISDNAPAAAQVDEILLHEVPLEDFTTFEIRFSDDAAVTETTLVSPDLATCCDCVEELFNPNDRRYRYPFINCTNCGPRFTIIDTLPYDRANTSMAHFPLCERCAHEYADPLDRRFHAQPDACFECGPHLSFATAQPELLMKTAMPQEVVGPCVRVWGMTRTESDALLAHVVELLLEGKILAIKGIGGFHLVCDARNEEAVATLRARKKREGKPFAVMMRDVADVRCVCEVGKEEEALLEGAQRPIVLLKKRKDASFVLGLADTLQELGVMLPYTPVQHLLLHDFCEVQPRGMLVMTSGNLHDEPIVIDDDKAYEKLAFVADAFLGNDREIRARYDDSVVRVIQAGAQGHAIQFIRRARGYSPVPLTYCTSPKDSIFATGPEQKNTFTLTRGTKAFVSQHIGDMENAETYDAWLAAKRRYEMLFEITPTHVACDLHPEYLTSKWAHEQQLPVTEVQHHHAHIVSVVAEHKITEPVCGIAFDGTGYGIDGTIWGGEVLLANNHSFERFANFAYLPLPGGAAAIKNPLRMAYGALWAFDLLDHVGAQGVLEALGAQAEVCAHMIERGVNTPMTSSVGRLFDAASALLGVCTHPLYEGEGAILLEAALHATSEGADVQERDNAATSDRYAIALTKNIATEHSTAYDTSVVLLDAAPTFRALLDDMTACVPIALIARRFHDAFVRAIVEVAELVQALYDIKTVALSGGVFMNRYLVEHALFELENAGFTAAINRDLPPNDGCISFGQAVVAWARNKDCDTTVMNDEHSGS